MLPSAPQDNYLDIIIDASDMQTAALLGSATVEAFHTDEGYAPLYNPGAALGSCPPQLSDLRPDRLPCRAGAGCVACLAAPAEPGTLRCTRSLPPVCLQGAPATTRCLAWCTARPPLPRWGSALHP